MMRCHLPTFLAMPPCKLSSQYVSNSVKEQFSLFRSFDLTKFYRLAELKLNSLSSYLALPEIYLGTLLGPDLQAGNH